MATVDYYRMFVNRILKSLQHVQLEMLDLKCLSFEQFTRYFYKEEEPPATTLLASAPKGLYCVVSGLLRDRLKSVERH